MTCWVGHLEPGSHLPHSVWVSLAPWVDGPGWGSEGGMRKGGIGKRDPSSPAVILALALRSPGLNLLGYTPMPCLTISLLSPTLLSQSTLEEAITAFLYFHVF